MMNGVIENPTAIRRGQREILIGMSLEEYRFMTRPMAEVSMQWTAEGELRENRFATVPMATVYPSWTRQRAQEEEWYTSFEQAISERAARVSERLRYLSTTAVKRSLPETDPLPSTRPALLSQISHFWCMRKRKIVLFCLSMALFFAGFDLMGLLVLLR
ncbi:MAG TPA: hypothetical protein VGD98_17710 [Ktedonobacteraceae bacterium]